MCVETTPYNSNFSARSEIYALSLPCLHILLSFTLDIVCLVPSFRTLSYSLFAAKHSGPSSSPLLTSGFFAQEIIKSGATFTNFSTFDS